MGYVDKQSTAQVTQAQPIGPDGRLLGAGHVVAIETVAPASGGPEVDVWPDTIATEARTVPTQLYALVVHDGVRYFVPTGNSDSYVVVQSVPVAMLAPPVIDDAARDRIARALADVLYAEVAR